MTENKRLYRKLYNKAHIAAYYMHKRRSYLTLAKKMSENIHVDESLFSKSIVSDYKNKWKSIDPFVSCVFFKLYSSLRGSVDINYVPDYLYGFPLEHILQNHRYIAYLENKAIYNMWLRDYSHLFPRTLFRKIGGNCFDENYSFVHDVDRFVRGLEVEELVAKPSIDTGSGKGVCMFLKNVSTGEYFNSAQINLTSLIARENDIVIQERVKQSHFMSSVNNTSVNTLRVVTYRSYSTSKVHIMQMLIKRGKHGLLVDNLNSGGSFIEVRKDGSFAMFGITKWGEKIPFSSSIDTLPKYEEVCSIAIEIASRDLINRQLYFDMFIDDHDKVRIMEINYSPHPTIQAVCGPAFADFTDEVIENTRNSSGTLVRLIPIKFPK